MIGPLALVGGDELKPGNEQQDEALAAAAVGGPAFVLATAAARQRPAAAVEGARVWFARFGLAVNELPVRTRTAARSPETAARASEGRMFYLLGGDPGIVPTVLAGSPVWTSILDAWVSGAALAGSSAGAMALGEWTLVRAHHPGDRVRSYRQALCVVPGVAVLPHFDGFGHRWIASALAGRPREDVVLVGIDERSAAVWLDGSWRVMGTGGVTVIASGDRRRFASGEAILGIPEPSAPATRS